MSFDSKFSISTILMDFFKDITINLITVAIWHIGEAAVLYALLKKI